MNSTIHRLRSFSPAIAKAALALAGVACSDDEDAGIDASEVLREVASCGSSEHAPCDVFDAACQARLAEIAACQWGGAGTAPVVPEIVAMTEEEVVQNLTMDAAVAMAEAPRAYEQVLTLLGLTAEGDLTVAVQAQAVTEQLLALYDFDSKVITMLARGEVSASAEANATLLHELIHAQQDAAYDLLTMTQAVRTSDEDVALRSLFEGEARFHDMIFGLGLQGTAIDPASFEGIASFVRDGTETQLFSEPGPYVNAVLAMPYIYGPTWVYSTWTTAGREAVQARYASPPSDSLEILQPAWGASNDRYGATPFPVANVFYINQLPPEGSEVYPIATNRLGAWSLYIAARVSADTSVARELARAWRGDQLDVFELDSGSAAGRWRMSFDTPEHTDAFAAVLGANPNVHVRKNRTTLVAVVTRDGQLPDWLFGPFGAAVNGG